jgi:hypothetical protein
VVQTTKAAVLVTRTTARLRLGRLTAWGLHIPEDLNAIALQRKSLSHLRTTWLLMRAFCVPGLARPKSEGKRPGTGRGGISRPFDGTSVGGCFAASAHSRLWHDYRLAVNWAGAFCQTMARGRGINLKREEGYESTFGTGICSLFGSITKRGLLGVAYLEAPRNFRGP